MALKFEMQKTDCKTNLSSNKNEIVTRALPFQNANAI